MNKQGFELGIKAIFTMIAGALILMFFIKFAFQQQSFQETVDTRKSLTNLDDHLDAFAIAGTSSKTITLPATADLSFNCKRLALNDYSRTDEKIIYAEPFTGKKINAWTQPWEFPYPITNFYYLDGGQRYILIYDQQSFDYVKNLKIPEQFSIQKQDIRTFNPTNLPEATLVFFTQPPQLQTTNTVIQIKLPSHEVVINKQTTYYIDEPMMLGAIFGPTEYQCLQEKALNNLKIITNIYSQKATLMSLKTSYTCKNYLYEAKNTLETFKQANNKEALYRIKEQVEKQNKNLQQHDCPTIY